MTAIGIKETPSTTTSELTTAFDEWLDGLATPQATLTKHSMEISDGNGRVGRLIIMIWPPRMVSSGSIRTPSPTMMRFGSERRIRRM